MKNFLNNNLSLRVRLTILFVLIFGTTTVIFSSFVYYKLNESLIQDFDNALFNYSIDISQTIEIGPRNDLNFPPLTVAEGKIFPFPSGTALILVRHQSGKILIKNGEFGDFLPPYKDEIEKVRNGAEAAYTTISETKNIPSAEAGSYRIITFPLDSETKPTLFLQISVPMVTFETQLQQLKNILKFGLPAVLLIAILAGLFFASRALRPIQELIHFTTRIDAEDLHERLPLPNAKDEIRTLTETLNQMLERIEKSFESQERFVADASHQLLTPLTILKGEMEIHQKNIQADQTKVVFKSLLQEVDNLAKIVQDMLLLARIDAGVNVITFSEVFIDEIIIDVVARLQKMANAKDIHIKLDFNSQDKRNPILGDPDLLANLTTNLVENAIKYSPLGSPIHILLTWTETESVLAIEDFGVGIADKDKAQLFNRFSRVNSSSKTKGFGLGLAIAQKIAKLHKSEIKFVNKETPGVKVELSFQHNNHI